MMGIVAAQLPQTGNLWLSISGHAEVAGTNLDISDTPALRFAGHRSVGALIR
jgi:hypothetical protein